ncbi:Uma2 family endonuclease, partial [bacterium]
MVVAPLSPAEYLKEESESPVKREYIDGRIVAMAGGSRIHGLVSSRLSRRLPLDDEGCEYLNSDVKLWIASRRSYLYPDGMIACPPNWVSDEAGAIDNPIVVFEVLSPSTELRDRTVKFDLYESLPSIREIVYISTDRRAAESFLRTGDGRWLRSNRSEGSMPLE